MSAPQAQLSCAQCQQRKKKCSKTIPCTACLKSGISCTAIRRTRLPRGRSGVKKQDQSTLQDRIARLEAIVARQAEPPLPIPSQLEGRHTPSVSRVDAFVAPEFWEELTDAVAGLKEVLHSDANDEHPDESISEDFGGLDSASLTSYLPLSNTPSLTRCFWPSLELKQRLLEVYHYRVDPVFKVLHWPSARDSILNRINQEQSASADLDPLEYSIYFTAICSLLDHEIKDRRALIGQARHDVELALTSADFLTSTELPVLQAFVIYLAGLRACQANAQQWTLLPTAIRMASAQGIPSRVLTATPTFDIEIKRRLWCCIGLLDLQCAFDRGTAPLLRSSDLVMLPLNLDDVALDQRATKIVEPSIEEPFTDMTFSRIVTLAGICQRKIVELEFSNAANGSGNEQVDVLAQFESQARSMMSSCGTCPTVFQRFTWAVAEESSIAMKLLLYRPLHKRERSHTPPAEPIDVLSVATEVLERSQTKRGLDDFSPWAWFSWIKWYALAIVLVELCTARGQLADHAWHVAQVSYQDYAEVVADTKRGLLWKPIERLMMKVKKVRSRSHLQPETPPQASDFCINIDLHTFGDLPTIGTNSAGEQDVDTIFGEHGDGMSWIHWDLFTEEILTDYGL